MRSLVSDPDVGHAHEALAKLELMIVQDIFLTETAKSNSRSASD